MKRVYLPEIKRIVEVDDSYLTLIHGVEGHRKELPSVIMHLPYPENCSKYEVRYRQSENGKYTAINGYGIHIYEGLNYINLACFVPDSWDGKKFNRYVKILS